MNDTAPHPIRLDTADDNIDAIITNDGCLTFWIRVGKWPAAMKAMEAEAANLNLLDGALFYRAEDGRDSIAFIVTGKGVLEIRYLGNGGWTVALQLMELCLHETMLIGDLPKMSVTPRYVSLGRPGEYIARCYVTDEAAAAAHSSPPIGIAGEYDDGLERSVWTAKGYPYLAAIIGTVNKGREDRDNGISNIIPINETRH